MYIPLKGFQKKALFIGDVSVNWATVRRRQVKLLDTWQVAQVNLPRQECIKCWYSGGSLPHAWRYRVSTRTGWPGVSILWLDEVANCIYHFHLSDRLVGLVVRPTESGRSGV